MSLQLLAWQQVQTQACLSEVSVGEIWTCTTSASGCWHMMSLLPVFEHIFCFVEMLKFLSVSQPESGRHCFTVFTLLILQLCNRPLHSHAFGWMHLDATGEICDCLL